MLRNAATRSLVRSLQNAPASRATFTATASQLRHTSRRQLMPSKRPQIVLLAHPTRTSFYATSSGPPYDKINPKEEAKIGSKVMQPHPDDVSAASSVRPILEPRSKQEEEDMMGGIKSDLKTIKETFSLNEVPRDTLLLGAAGVIPYAATSFSTVYLAWDINHAHYTGGNGLLLTPEQAHYFLELITPLQIGWGAIVSLLLALIISIY